MNTDNQTPGFRAMPRPQKTAIIVLALLGVAVIVFWAWQFRSQLRRPFNLGGSGQPTANIAALDLHDVDSDSDGLSDYDEINVYYTSPYLEDSDSDDLFDLKEVQQGTDPNCPEGKTCLSPAVAASSTIPQITLPEDNAGVLADTSTLQNIISGQIDATTLRQLLIQSGADQSILDQISDEDLMKSYQETLNSQDTQTNQ